MYSQRNECKTKKWVKKIKFSAFKKDESPFSRSNNFFSDDSSTMVNKKFLNINVYNFDFNLYASHTRVQVGRIY